MIKLLVAQRLSRVIELSGYSYAQLEQLTGIPKSTLQRYATGKTKKIPFDCIQKIATATNSDLKYLTGAESEVLQGTTLDMISGDKIYKIPVFESVSAGFGTFANSDVVDYYPLYIPNVNDVPDMLCIKVKGNSMYPKIEDGDIIVVRKQDSVDSGSIAVVLVDGEEGFVKRVVYDDDTIELQSINPEYAPKIFKGADVLCVRVVGIVKQVIKTL